jgi:hypothetical protein
VTSTSPTAKGLSFQCSRRLSSSASSALGDREEVSGDSAFAVRGASRDNRIDASKLIQVLPAETLSEAECDVVSSLIVMIR